MTRIRTTLTVALVPLLAGCLATKRDLQDLRTQMDADRAEQNRQIQALISRTESMLDSLSLQNSRLRADVANRLLQIDRQLVQIQSLSGQSQQQIRDLQRQIEQRAAEARAAQAEADSAAATPADDTAGRTASSDRPASSDRSASPDRPASSGRTGTDRTASSSPDRPAPGTTTTRPSNRRDDAPPTADDAYEAAMGAFQRGSLATARSGFQEFLRIAPNDRRAAEAQFYIGETYARDPDAAIAAYQRVVDRYPTSPRAPGALLRIAKLEIARGDRTQARAHLNQILRSYPRSDEADEARTQLQRLGTR